MALPDIDQTFEMRLGERLPPRLGFIRWLDGARITSAAWSVPDLTVTNVTSDETSTSALVEGGTAVGERYPGTVTVETTDNAILKARIEIVVVE